MAIRGLDTLTKVDIDAMCGDHAGCLTGSNITDLSGTASALALPQGDGTFQVVDASQYRTAGTIFQQVSRFFETQVAQLHQTGFVEAHATNLLNEAQIAQMHPTGAGEVTASLSEYTLFETRLKHILDAFDVAERSDSSVIGTIAKYVRAVFVSIGLTTPSNVKAKIRSLKDAVSGLTKEMRSQARRAAQTATQASRARLAAAARAAADDEIRVVGAQRTAMFTAGLSFVALAAVASLRR